MKKLFLLLSVFFICRNGSSQDIHFSQFNENPSLVNPALTGSQYVMRASVIYRDQWRSITVPYKTYGASYEMKFKASGWEKADDFKTKAYKKAFNRLAGGISFYSDKAGDGNLRTNEVYLSLASIVRTGEFSYLSLGLQGGLAQKSIDYSSLVFPNQYNAGVGYDPSMPNGEQFNQSFMYQDYSAGIVWNYSKGSEMSTLSPRQMRADLGVAMYHFNTPDQSFYSNGDAPLYAKYVVHGKLFKGISSAVIFSPSFICQFQGPATEIVAGMMLLKNMKVESRYTGNVKQSSFGFGAYYRVKDAVILLAMLNLGQVGIGLSYDINASGLSSASVLGGPEIMIRFNSVNPYLFQKR